MLTIDPTSINDAGTYQFTVVSTYSSYSPNNDESAGNSLPTYTIDLVVSDACPCPEVARTPAADPVPGTTNIRVGTSSGPFLFSQPTYSVTTTPGHQEKTCTNVATDCKLDFSVEPLSDAT